MNASHRQGAHAFEPPEGQDPKDPATRCSVCGEHWNYIQHHPTRIRAAQALEEAARPTAAPNAAPNEEPGAQPAAPKARDAGDR